MSRHGRHEDGVGWNPNGVYCGECGQNSCLCCIRAKDKPIKQTTLKNKTFIITAILVHKNDAFEPVGPVPVTTTTKTKALKILEKHYNGWLRDVKIKELE